MPNLIDFIHSTPDFPQNGVIFRDISPLLSQKFPETVQKLAELFSKDEIEGVNAFAGVDSRGFIFASALATHFGKNLVLIRKAGKLPPPVLSQACSLEYGSAILEMKPGSGKVILVDDVLATGGTLSAAADLCVSAGYEVRAIAALIDLPALNQFNWHGQNCRSLFQF